mmetsp:Transcript_51080/g.83888  ORF Transcript_51080/g.83888 Transcript_51080/m.83888 type:complete len:135 (-) Transcript_51080:836-1240(-)
MNPSSTVQAFFFLVQASVQVSSMLQERNREKVPRHYISSVALNTVCIWKIYMEYATEELCFLKCTALCFIILRGLQSSTVQKGDCRVPTPNSSFGAQTHTAYCKIGCICGRRAIGASSDKAGEQLNVLCVCVCA